MQYSTEIIVFCSFPYTKPYRTKTKTNLLYHPQPQVVFCKNYRNTRKQLFCLHYKRFLAQWTESTNKVLLNERFKVQKGKLWLLIIILNCLLLNMISWLCFSVVEVRSKSYQVLNVLRRQNIRKFKNSKNQ